MSNATTERREAAKLPEGDVVGILLTQHARIRDLFEEVKTTRGEHKQQVFDELRALMAVHETAEEIVLRPVAEDTAGKAETEARNHEEEEATKTLAELEKLDVNSADFDAKLVRLEQSVIDHAEREELEEFPTIRDGISVEQRQKMGKRLEATEKLAPTHPHPSTAGSPGAQAAVGPFASLVDRTKDALKSRGSEK